MEDRKAYMFKRVCFYAFFVPYCYQLSLNKDKYGVSNGSKGRDPE